MSCLYHFQDRVELTFVVNVTVHSSTGSSQLVLITIHEMNSEVAKKVAIGASGTPFTFNVDAPELWTPDTPNLYNITVRLGSDIIRSYTGFRSVSRGVVGGVQRPLLNGEFIFPFGTLDQGKFLYLKHISGVVLIRS